MWAYLMYFNDGIVYNYIFLYRASSHKYTRPLYYRPTGHAVHARRMACVEDRDERQNARDIYDVWH
jgi:ADP-heptose:LPS heptosyltransferase